MLLVDDPVLLRQEISRLKELLALREEENIQLRNALRPPDWEPPVEIGLTPQEARCVATLFKSKGEVASKDQLYYALYHDSHEEREIKIIDVFICKLRKKLKEYGIEVLTAWGRGYYLDKASIEILSEWGLDPQESEPALV